MNTTVAHPSHIDLPEPWRRAVAVALAARGVVMVVGGPDSGKSTFCRYLLDEAGRRRRPLAFIDADLGQSHVGPPTTIGLQLYPCAGPDDWSLHADLSYFIGQTSPPGRLLEIVVGLRRLVDEVRHRRRLLIVNTSGFINGPAALRLKTAKAEVLQPRLGVMLGRHDELFHLLPPLTVLCQETHLLSVSSQARQKSWEERRRYRQERFAAFFAKARPQHLPLRGVTWLDFPFAQGPRLTAPEHERLQDLAETSIYWAERRSGCVYLVTAAPLPEAVQSRVAAHLAPEHLVWAPWNQLMYRLVGMLDIDMYTLSLGILLEVDWPKEEITLLTPLAAKRLPAVRFLRLGKLRLNPSGQELPPF
ncbi:MAG: Clp1/GlmU family protein [Desulfobacca sp.]|uniref:Clp1/GlmU family protein n=1 Tax=Desulfobacca sp. TaxID=2067990 RepID=UPI00404B371B